MSTSSTRTTKPETLLEELEGVASSMSVKVSYEALQAVVGSGGLCRVKGQHRVIMDKRSSTGERLATLAQALVTLGVDPAPLSAPVRELLAHYTMRRAS